MSNLRIVALFLLLFCTIVSPSLVAGIPSQAVPYKGHALPILRGAMVNPSFMNGKDQVKENLSTLSKDWNANIIRWQLRWVPSEVPESYKIFDDTDTAQYAQWLNHVVGNLDTVVRWCKSLKLYVVVDLHTPPGESTKDLASKKLLPHRVF
jgi:Cellulase (glycosyl hydrolase family 5)